MSMDWMLRQLAQVSSTSSVQEARKASFNPKPRGSVQAGSATHRLLQAMAAAPARWWNYRELSAAAAGGSRHLSWALLLLKRRGHIEAANNDVRNPRCTMYRITQAGRHATPFEQQRAPHSVQSDSPSPQIGPGQTLTMLRAPVKGTTMTIRTHSPITTWLTGYLADQPNAQPKRAWFFLIRQALPLGVEGIEGFDLERRELVYRMKTGTAHRMNRDSFSRVVRRTRERMRAGR